jgi:polyisoprenoid-binding protein YceI
MFEICIMKNILISILILITGSVASAQLNWSAVTYSVKFSISHALGATATGKFSGLSASIVFVPEELAKSKILATVDASTFYTGNKTRDNNIKAEKYLNATKYPKIAMESTKIVQALGGKGFIGYFDVKIKDKIKNIAVPFSFIQTGDKATFTGSVVINRLDFEVGESSYMLGDEATLDITVEAVKK